MWRCFRRGFPGTRSQSRSSFARSTRFACHVHRTLNIVSRYCVQHTTGFPTLHSACPTRYSVCRTLHSVCPTRYSLQCVSNTLGMRPAGLSRDAIGRRAIPRGTRGIHMKREFNLNVSSNEIYCTNSLILLVRNMLWSELHCQKVLI